MYIYIYIYIRCIKSNIFDMNRGFLGTKMLFVGKE